MSCLRFMRNCQPLHQKENSLLFINENRNMAIGMNRPYFQRGRLGKFFNLITYK
jgi:hypothetical protein